MKVGIDVYKEIATINLSGRFDFNALLVFKEATDSLINNSDVQTIDINFSNVSYLDSSALGMLMVLREKTLSSNKKARISQCHGLAKDILDTANFHKQFEFV